VDWISWAPSLVSVAAILFAALTLLESRKQRRLLETMVKAMPYVTKPKKKSTKKKESKPRAPAIPSPPPSMAAVPATTIDPIKAAAEERRRLRLELEREKLQWQKSKDVAKAIAWLLDRMDETEDDYTDD